MCTLHDFDIGVSCIFQHTGDLHSLIRRWKPSMIAREGIHKDALDKIRKINKKLPLSLLGTLRLKDNYISSHSFALRIEYDRRDRRVGIPRLTNAWYEFMSARERIGLHEIIGCGEKLCWNENRFFVEVDKMRRFFHLRTVDNRRDHVYGIHVKVDILYQCELYEDTNREFPLRDAGERLCARVDTELRNVPVVRHPVTNDPVYGSAPHVTFKRYFGGLVEEEIMDFIRESAGYNQSVLEIVQERNRDLGYRKVEWTPEYTIVIPVCNLDDVQIQAVQRSVYRKEENKADKKDGKAA
ncbi:MAG: hypothetical protein V1740_05020 [Candidatus Woesearchaeota archaeon]